MCDSIHSVWTVNIQQIVLLCSSFILEYVVAIVINTSIKLITNINVNLKS